MKITIWVGVNLHPYQPESFEEACDLCRNLSRAYTRVNVGFTIPGTDILVSFQYCP